MPPRNVHQGHSGLVRAASLWAILAWSTPLAAQQLALERDYPGFGPFACPAPSVFAPPAPEDRAQAGQLASDALQAVILGELLRAQELLARATELDASSAELAYRHARVLQDMAAYQEAMREYCRALELGAEEAGILDSQTRIEGIYEIVRDQVPPAARSAFVDGVTLADAGMYEPSVDAFSLALDASPNWSVALYNRAVVLEALGRLGESLSDYRRFLEITPTDIDPVVARVTERVGLLEGMVAAPTPSPGGVLALGAVFPGMGQYYSGRTVGGTIVLGVASTALATGLLYKEITVYCVNPPVGGGDCPPGEAVDETTRRPYLVPALAVAGAVTLVAAIEAFVRARGRRAAAEGATVVPAAQATRQAAGPRLTGPSLTAQGGRLRLQLIGLRFH
jgi:tetratricopeptide (TPR) repeat protein